MARPRNDPTKKTAVRRGGSRYTAVSSLPKPDHSRTMQSAPDLFSYRKHWAHKLGTAPELPMSRAEMDLLGWDSCDIVIVTGDAYVDHPSFGMAIIGRLLEAQGFRVGIIAQPDWTSAEPLRALGAAEPVLRRHRRQHGLDGEPLHVRPTHALRRRLFAGRPGRTAAGSFSGGLCAARARGLQGCAGGHRRHRGQPAAHRTLRLLVRQGASLSAAGREGGSADLRQRRTCGGGAGASPRPR